MSSRIGVTCKTRVYPIGCDSFETLRKHVAGLSLWQKKKSSKLIHLEFGQLGLVSSCDEIVDDKKRVVPH